MVRKEILKEAESKMKKTLESVRREFSEVRTGRAHPALIEGLHIDYYGTPTMLKEIASISIPEPRMIVIQPWDQAAIPDIEKGIQSSNLGATPSTAGTLVRLTIPPLSEERRNELKKVVKEMAENGRISLRTIRRDANDTLKKSDDLSEDEVHRGLQAVQETTDRYIARVDDIVAKKEQEILEV